ncbi:hypothetical protein LAZ67_9001968 [Cordylochernes scorpioides]|uniref:Mos1 transposase HTH domain-containing protein n=1 Tax=Cordylochernes scorpioides TaxID=51811 RepID=A0ABY6KW80_9ARAC|nr:hypothetical protein LAZ67_9001968 [Cordylochernes scorpioides]
MHCITIRVPFSKTLLRIKTSQKHNNSTNLEVNWCGCIPLGVRLLRNSVGSYFASPHSNTPTVNTVVTLTHVLNMPRRSRPLIGRNTAASRRYRNAIAIETPLQSETRRALRHLRYSEARVAAAQTMQVPVQRIQLWTHKPFSGLQYNTHIDYKADSSVDIGQMSRVCQFCSALRFRDEPFGLCCKQGVLDRLRFLPIKKMDQRTCIKFCVKNEIKCADAFRMLTVAYGEATLDRSNVYRWYKMFSEGREDVNDEERAGHPSTSTTDEKINEVEKMILANRRITVREVSEDLNISIGSCHSIFINDLGMRRVAAKFVPKLLNCDQKQHRMNIANEMLDSVRDHPNLLQRVITGEKAWVYGYDVETKAQSSQWKLPHEPRPKKARQVRSNVKVLLTVFFDCRGVVHHVFLPQGRTVNKEYYLQVMRNLREAIRQKRPDLRKNKNWLLHHDNAPAHTSLLVRDFLAKKKTTH